MAATVVLDRETTIATKSLGAGEGRVGGRTTNKARTRGNECKVELQTLSLIHTHRHTDTHTHTGTHTHTHTHRHAHTHTGTHTHTGRHTDTQTHTQTHTNTHTHRGTHARAAEEH